MLEISEDLESQLPAEYVERLAARTVVCTPISARGRWLGVILADRGGDGPPLTDAEREVLWILGKMAALASMARAATRQHERAVALEQRIDLAREVHEGVVQRLFGVSLALSGEQPLDERDAPALRRGGPGRRSATCAPRCSARSAARRAATTTTLGEEVERLRHEYPTLGIALDERRRELRGCPRRSSRSPSRCSPRRSATPHKHAHADARRRAHASCATARSCSR